jgi:hypothetical protein
VLEFDKYRASYEQLIMRKKNFCWRISIRKKIVKELVVTAASNTSASEL